MTTIRKLLKRLTADCDHPVRRVTHDYFRMTATLACDVCGETLSTFELKEQADTFQLAGDGE